MKKTLKNKYVSVPLRITVNGPPKQAFKLKITHCVPNTHSGTNHGTMTETNSL